MAQIISNQANIAYSVVGSEERKNAVSNIANTILLDAYSLEVNKQSLQKTFTPGENLTYTIRVTNNGYKGLTDFSIVDNVTTPAEGNVLTYMQYTARLSYQGDMISLTPTSTDPLTFSVPYQLASGESFTLTYVAVVSESLANSVTKITNSVTVTGKPANDPDNVQSYSAEDIAEIMRDTSASLSIVKTTNAPVIFDSQAYQYILTIENNGMSDASNVVITDQLPTGFKVANIRVENEDFVHDYEPSEYTITEANFLTLPNDSGTAINIKCVDPGVNNTTVITISGSYNTPED